MKTLSTLGVVALIATAAVSGFAATSAHKTKAAVKQAPLICPVTGDKIASVKDAVGHSVYKGKTYYFCCPDCKPLFDKNPAKYLKPATVKKHMM